MALPVYTYGSIPTDLEFNAFLRPAFNKDETEEEFPGSLRRLRDDALSNDPTQLKPRFEKFENELRVTAGNGLTINYVGGTVILPDSTSQTINAGTLAVPNNSTVIVHVTTTGTIAAAVNPPVTRLDLARVTTVAGAVTTISDLRPRFRILPRADAIKVFGGSGDQGDYILDTTATLSESEYYYRNFTIEATGVLTIPASVRIYCSGDVTIRGTISIGTPILGGGGTGAVIASGTQDIRVHISGSGQGLARGINGGSAYNYTMSPVGSGGAGSFCSGSNHNVSLGEGGAGAGAIVIEAGGTIRVEAGATLSARGGNATIGTVTSSTALNQLTGAGGGSGGLILLKSLIAVIIQGTLDVRGGNGSNAAFSGSDGSQGGGGGGGGQIALIAPTVNTTSSTLQLLGGTAGTNLGSSNFAGGGGGGGFGGRGGATAQNGSVGRLIVRNLKGVA
jgi:hypothetical protein